jgi:cytoskeletal protein RodZ
LVDTGALRLKGDLEPKFQGEAMDEELVESHVPTVGERLRAAREEKKLSLEDVAAQTRIPQRHLESIEIADWEKLPAPTYTVGFAKSYASAVGLDRTDIGDQLREEMGGLT